MVAPEGFLLGSIQRKAAALLHPASLTWTVLNVRGKTDGNAEEGWSLLPNGSVLTVDIFGQGLAGTQSEIYSPYLDLWTSAGSTKVQLWSSPSLCGKTGKGGEIGPAVLRPDGTVFAIRRGRQRRRNSVPARAMWCSLP